MNTRSNAIARLVSPRHFVLFVTLLAAALCSGCVSEPISEFRGTIARGVLATNAPSVYPIGSDFQVLDPKFTDALTAFGLSAGTVLFIHDRQKYVDKDYRLSNDGVKAVYFMDPESGINEDAFLGEDIARRDTAGVHRLEGSFNVDKWRSNVNFRIRLAMHSSDTNNLVIQGVLTTHDRWIFNPFEAFVLTLGAMGIAGE